MSGEQPSKARKPRKDAEQNAERVIAAAVRAGLAEGKFVPLAQIAADAGVGIVEAVRARGHQTSRLADSGGRMSLVVFSDVAYQALPPGTPSSALRP